MHALLAALPIGLVIAAMVVFRWRAASAGMLGLATALLLAIAVFGHGTDVHRELGPGMAIGGAMVEALFITLTILWIIFPALCIYEMQARSGAFETIRSGLSRISSDPRVLALLVAWFFGLFMEGVAGFGTPVALAAPILVGLGFAPVRAVTLALIGHAAGVSFGAVGTPILPQMAASGLSGLELARPAALLHALLGGMLAAAVFMMASPDRTRPRDWLWPALAAFLFLAPFLLLAWLVGPELPTLGGAIIGGSLFALIAGRRRGGGGDRPGPAVGEMARAALPYLLLLALIVLTRLVPPVREAMRGIEIAWSLSGAFSGRMEPLYHPGTLLFLAFMLGGLLRGRSPAELGSAMAGAARRLGVVALALAAMLGLSRVLMHSGMIETLAQAAAASGALWPFLAPFIGVLGSFVTGSATSSNILFSDFQRSTATALSLPAVVLHGAQNFGAGIGNIISPHNIIAGAATVGLASGREGEVMRDTIVVCLLYAAGGGGMIYLMLRGASAF